MSPKVGSNSADYGPDTSSSPVQSSAALRGALEPQSPYTNAPAHWTSNGVSSYVKQPPTSATLHNAYSLDQSYLHHSARDASDISVGLPRYSSHSTPMCERKDLVLNLNGISSLHPSNSSASSGSYYHQQFHQSHHLHQQSSYQDVKPCVI